MRPAPGKTWPIEQLERAIGCGSADVVADILGVKIETVHYFRQRGGFSEPTADKYACRAGFHPFKIWPEWFTVTVNEAESAEQVRRANYTRRLHNNKMRARAKAAQRVAA